MEKHLWEVNHPYYCNEGNYYSNDCCDTYKRFADFMSEYNDADLDMNLVFRFDWVEQDEDSEENSYDGDDNYRNGTLKIFWLGQRKGIYRFTLVDVCRADELKVIEFLRPRFDHLKTLWAPFV